MNATLDAFSLPISLSRPRRRTGVRSWVQHIPFALNLVAAVQPRLLVELGTHAGDSYCALCQAVAEASLEARCFAVDTWKGDPQAGFYGPEILADLRAHHDPLYGSFSRLIQSTFDEALAHFADGAIDLLHIDGLHTYEAVKHDWEAWRPKLSARAVVLFHDTEVREGEFGVAQLWEELAGSHPHFGFVHGHGLGVLVPGPEIPPGLEPLLRAGPRDTATVRAFFHELGRRLENDLELDRLARDLAGEQAKIRELEGRRVEAAAQLAQMGSRASDLEREHEGTLARLRAQELDLEKRAAELHETQAALRTSRAELATTQQALKQAHATVEAMAATTVWRLGTRYWHTRDRLLAPGTLPRRVLDRAMEALTGKAGRAAAAATLRENAPATREAQYPLWLRRHAVTPGRAAELAREARSLRYTPVVSVITPVHDIPEPWLRRCIESVISQTYPHWELCLVDDGSTQPHVARVLDEYARGEPRLKVRKLGTNRGIIGASSAAMELASGELVAFLDHDDELAPHALQSVVTLLQDQPDLELVYSDEDKLDEEGRRVEPFFKPDWSPDLLLSMNYVCHLLVVRTKLVEQVGGFRPGFEGSQDYDLLLRLTERTRRIGHVADVLYHWRKVPGSAAAERTAKPYALASGLRALESAMERRGMAGKVLQPHPGAYRVLHALPEPAPLVSIIIPTRDHADLLRTCIDSIEERSTYGRYEIVVIDNGSAEPATLRHLEALGQKHRVIRDGSAFNWSRLNNGAARIARGELLLFMNNDMEVVSPGWLEAMVEHASRREVGAVGAKLLYADGRIQHAGVVLGIGGVAGHAFKYLPGDGEGYFLLPQVVRNVGAVTGACLMVRKAVFEEVGGFDERLRVAFNDIDFCLKLRERGYLNVYTPYAVLHHYESASRGPMHPPEDERLMRDRWATVLARDPYYNPHLSLTWEDYRLAIEPT